MNWASVMLGAYETKWVARNTENMASLVPNMTILIFWSFLAVLMGNIYDSSDRITFLSFKSLSTNMVMSKLVIKLIKGQTAFIGKVTDSSKVKFQKAYKLKKQQQQQQQHWNSDDCIVHQQNQKTRISERWPFPRLQRFWEKVGLVIPRLGFF